MTTFSRWMRFNGVGAAGVAVQLAIVAALVEGAGASYRMGTMVGVAAAVVHNFAWHLRWTWADRQPARSHALRAFVCFVAANGVVSLAGNLLLMELLAGMLRIPAVVANAVAIALCSLVNYWLADTVVFPRVAGSR